MCNGIVMDILQLFLFRGRGGGGDGTGVVRRCGGP